MSDLRNSRFTLGKWTIDPVMGQIRHGEETQFLRPGLMDVLVFLAERAGDIVSSQEVIDGPWNGIIVSDASVYRAISDLRKCLGDTEHSKEFIKTVPRRGYQLIAPVVLATDDDQIDGKVSDTPSDSDLPIRSGMDEKNAVQATSIQAHTDEVIEQEDDRSGREGPHPSVWARVWRSRKRAAITIAALLVLVGAGTAFLSGVQDQNGQTAVSAVLPEVTVAVLPFVNLSGDPRQEYLSDGISEGLVNLLARSRQAKVAASRSSFAYKGKSMDVREVAEFLGVRHVVEGSVNRVGSTVRVSAQLVDSNTGFVLWSNSFDTQTTDLLHLQDVMSEEILRSLGELSAAPVLASPKAYKTGIEVFNSHLLGEHYLKQRNRAALTKALAHFDRAITLDPNYPLSYVGKANVYLLLSEKLLGTIPEDDVIFGASVLIDRALAIDPNIASALVAKGQIHYYQGEFEAAGEKFNKAIEMDPSLSEARFWSGRLHLENLRIREALKDFEDSLRLDPLAMAPFINLIQTLALVGEIERAEQVITRFQVLAPDEPSTFATTIVMSSIGRLAAAFEAAREAVSVNDFERYRQELSVLLVELREIDQAVVLAPDTNPLFVYKYLDPDQAMRLYLDLPSNSVDQNEIWLNMAVAEFLNNNFQSSAQYFERAIEFDLKINGPLFGAIPERMRAPYLAFAWKQTGQNERAGQLIALIEDVLDRLVSQGATARHLVFQARLHVLKGEMDEAVTTLQRAHEEQNLPWYVLEEPFFDEVRERPDFKALVAGVDAHIDQERAKLGWIPVKT